MPRKTKPSRTQASRLVRGRMTLANQIAHGFADDHEANMTAEGRTMPEHRREESKCSYCRLIREAKAYLRKEKRYDFSQRYSGLAPR